MWTWSWDINYIKFSLIQFSSIQFNLNNCIIRLQGVSEKVHKFTRKEMTSTNVMFVVFFFLPMRFLLERPEFNNFEFSVLFRSRRLECDTETRSLPVNIPKFSTFTDLHGWINHPGNHLQSVSNSAGAGEWRGGLRPYNGGEGALLFDRSRHHVGRREGEDAWRTTAVRGKIGGGGHGGTGGNDSIGWVGGWPV